MAFNRTSYMAGVGSVFMVLSTGFAGGYFMANPTHNDPPNRLQRLASAQDAKPVAQATPSAKPEMVPQPLWCPRQWLRNLQLPLSRPYPLNQRRSLPRFPSTRKFLNRPAARTRSRLSARPAPARRAR